MRLARACVLLEVIDDQTGQLSAVGYELLGPGAEADVHFEHILTRPVPSRYDIRLRGRGREFHLNLGQWYKPPPQRELSPAPGECPAGGEHTWAELETWDHKMGVGCDECGATYPREQ